MNNISNSKKMTEIRKKQINQPLWSTVITLINISNLQEKWQYWTQQINKILLILANNFQCLILKHLFVIIIFLITFLWTLNDITSFSLRECKHLNKYHHYSELGSVSLSYFYVIFVQNTHLCQKLHFE